MPDIKTNMYKFKENPIVVTLDIHNPPNVKDSKYYIEGIFLFLLFFLPFFFLPYTMM